VGRGHPLPRDALLRALRDRRLERVPHPRGGWRAAPRQDGAGAEGRRRVLTAPPPPARSERALVAALAALSAAPRAWAAWSDHGVLWPDEIFQSIEQAHRAVFGRGLQPWEFIEGARSWLFPGLLAGLLKLGALLGLSDGLSLVRLPRLCMAALSVLCVLLGARLAGRMAGPRAAVLAAALIGFYPPLVAFGSRCTAESASAPALLGAALLALYGASRGAALGAGALCGLACFLRFQNGLVALALLAALALREDRRALAWFALGGVAAALAGGLLDLATWGRPFHSLLAYARFNLLEGRSTRWGTSPWSEYLRRSLFAAGWPAVLIAIGLLSSLRRHRAAALAVLLYLVAHSLVGHKEHRFLVPVLPLLLAVSAAGLVELAALARSVRPALGATAAALLVAAVVSLAVKLPGLTGGELEGHPRADTASVWHHDEALVLGLSHAGRMGATCGVLLDREWFRTGGHTYLHKPAALAFDRSDRSLRAANVFLGEDGAAPPAGYTRLVQREPGRFALYLREGPCSPE
jgi:hypothetical protein